MEIVDDERVESWINLANALVVPEQSIFLRVFAMLAMEYEREICASIASEHGAHEVAELIRSRGVQ